MNNSTIDGILLSIHEFGGFFSVMIIPSVFVGRLQLTTTLTIVLCSLGATPMMELMIAAGKAVAQLQIEHGLAVERVYTGSFMTSLDMAGSYDTSAFSCSMSGFCVTFILTLWGFSHNFSSRDCLALTLMMHFDMYGFLRLCGRDYDPLYEPSLSLKLHLSLKRVNLGLGCLRVFLKIFLVYFGLQGCLFLC